MPPFRKQEVYMDELQRRIHSVYMCINCGTEIGRVERKYCDQCSTKAGRDELAQENVKITAKLNELREKGEWIYALP